MLKAPAPGPGGGSGSGSDGDRDSGVGAKGGGPLPRPIIQFTVHLSVGPHQRLRETATRRGMSRAKLVESIRAECVGAEGPPGPPPPTR